MSGAFLVLASFLASAVEMVEALTIVLAVGVTRGCRHRRDVWRDSPSGWARGCRRGGGSGDRRGRGRRGPPTAQPGAGEYPEVRGGLDALVVRHVLGGGGRRGELAG